MKLRYFLIALLAVVSTAPMSAALQFSKSSRLRTGNWVKIGVEKSGIYEISYQTLRDMGFSDPASISLYGRGGAMQDGNFTNAGGTPLFSDDLEEVPLYHYGDKIYFYGVGTESIALQTSTKVYECGGFFYSKGRNIYTDRGYYFLSDEGSGVKMAEIAPSNLSNTAELQSGISYLYHEEDLNHNHTQTGQIYLGERTTPENPQIEWDVYLPGALENTLGAMHCIYYMDRKVEVPLEYGFKDTETFISTLTDTSSSSNFTATTPTQGPAMVPGEHSTVFVYCDPGTERTTSNVDHWTVTYQRNIPNLIGEKGKMNQDFIAFPALTTGKTGKILIPGGASFIAMDITRPYAPTVLSIDPDGADGWCKVANTSGSPQVMIFNPMMPQMQIVGYDANYKKIKNQDLHARLAEGADLLIICIPALKESAEKLADVHRNYENLKVVVATTDECYNEFSSGIPDPMAYRAAVKMAYSTSYSCKNLLLMGPLFADFRGVVTEKEPEEGIIAYQSHPMNQERGAMNANDFYGIMANYLTKSALESEKMEVGVGVLPIRYPAEADLIIDKVVNFLEFDDHAYYMNRHTSIGGVGDSHSHDQMAVNHSAYMGDLTNYSTISSTIAIDAYGYKEAQRKFFKNLDEGQSLITYIGHGSEYTLNHEGDFFYASDVYKLRNKILPIMFFAGCELTNSDRGVRGMGESLVTSTPYGLLGSIAATRETWSGQNEDLVKQFYLNLYRNGGYLNAAYHQKNLTIGEIWARMKSQSIFNNELAYLLICDPAITIPVVNRNIQFDQREFPAVPGEYIEISGYVPMLTNKDVVDTSFNATLVARLVEPTKVLRSPDLITSGENGLKVLDVTYADTQMSMTSAEIVDGRFTARLFIPKEARQFIGQKARIYVTSYNKETKVGAGCQFAASFIDAPNGTSSVEKDTEAPQITQFIYNPDERRFEVEVTDNFALSFADTPLLSPFSISIDGVDYPAASNLQAIVYDSGRTMTKKIPVVDIPVGTHVAKLRAVDANGNEGTAEITFEYNPNASRFAIRLEESAVAGTAHFTITGNTPEAADIIILDSNGMLVRRDKFNGSSYEWDTRDNGGLPVAKGLYKAYMIETGAKSGKGHSATISVPVI